MKTNPYAHAPRLPDGEIVDPRLLVGGSAGGEPIEIEVGPGRGGFMFERLAADPSVRMLGLEIRRKWATIVDDRLRERGLGERARVLSEDAKLALPRFPVACARAVFVHFPDPWWKKRHHKRLVVTSELLAEVCRVLCPGGELFIQTDVSERAEAYAALVAAEPRLRPLGSGFSAENPFGAKSPREHRAIADGLPIYRLHSRLTGA
ncbi:MAG TPA: tRNA (guanine-N7)-methyltransferase [Polyangiaceae bacterium]|jgi:tRNA (guanine-N7-)-methyltransferase|nr:tRNA (guanine-N7)-methyltransferase [Polyangiaceae bacterium]